MSHSSRTQSLNASRRLRNQRENEFIIPEVVKHVMNHSSHIAGRLLEAGEFPINFEYELNPIISMKQRELGIDPYNLRDSKIQQIITSLEDQESGIVAPVANFHIDESGNIILSMLRA